MIYSGKKVYLLSHYDEYGSEDVVGTLDKSSVIDLLRNFSSGVYFDEANKKLRELLLDDGLVTSYYPIDLMTGWGGPQLHVIPLQEKEEQE